MDPNQVNQPARSTGIPRLSRLPLPRSSLPVLAAAQPSTVRKTPSRSNLVSRSKPANDSNFKPPSKPPSKPPVPANSRKLRTVNSNLRASTAVKPTAASSARSNARSPARPSDKTQDGSDGQDDGQKTPDRRQTLSERTMDSIAMLPPTPANRRRRSSFFNPESPMVSRPQSAAGTLSRPGSRAEPVPPMPVLKPSFKSSTTSRPSTFQANARRSVSMAASTSTRPPTSTRPGANTSTYKSATMKASSRPIPPTKSTQSSTVRSKPTTSRPSIKTTTPRPALRTSTANIKSDAADSTKTPPNPTKSSAALREQIRAAKAARKSTNTQVPDGKQPAATFTDIDRDVDDDPFNQGLKGGALVMRKRVDAARSEGRLNISNLDLKEIPEEVLKMYDYDYNKGQSGIAWGEVMDLSRFIAADNELETIPNECFPDVDVHAMGHDEDTNPVFGGIDHLDLHGNLLFDVPVGLRRLERLTYLNLSRNRLMNDALETITQIKSLTELKITDNSLSGELTASIGNLTELESLELQGNKLSSLPSELGTLTYLKVLNLSNNQLTDIPIAAICELPLTRLYLSKNRLSGTLFSSPDATMSRLQVLDVSVNSLHLLASDTLSLPAIKELNIGFNRITSLPNISSWKNLSSLIAEDNKISELPEGFLESDQLRSADFTGNDFSKIDARIGIMDGLENIRFAANPMRERKFLTMGSADLKRDLRARLGLDQPGSEVD